MKIIGKSNREGAFSSEFIVTIGEDELYNLLGFFYRTSTGAPSNLKVGDEVNAKKMLELADEMRALKENLIKAPQTLRALAEIVDRECDPITRAPSPEPKGVE